MVMITSAVFVGVLFKAGLDVIDRDYINAYIKNKWKANKNRNIQLFFIVYSTIITVIIDLNVAVISGTIFFYLAKKYFKISDAEDSYEIVDSEDITG